jgi:hypothetical protein
MPGAALALGILRLRGWPLGPVQNGTILGGSIDGFRLFLYLPCNSAGTRAGVASFVPGEIPSIQVEPDGLGQSPIYLNLCACRRTKRLIE